MELKNQESKETGSVNGRAIIDIEGEGVLLIKRKTGHFAGKWELPGGKLSEQNIEEELAREIKEETGLEIDPKNLTEVLFYGVVDTRKKASFFEKEEPMIKEDLFMIRLKKGDIPTIRIGEEHSSFLIVNEDKLKEEGFEEQLTDLARAALSIYFYDIKRRALSGKPLLVGGPVWNSPDKNL